MRLLQVLLVFPLVTGDSRGENHSVAVVLSSLALMLAVVSAASRAYRAGFTIPDEQESYVKYADQVATLQKMAVRVQPEEFLKVLAKMENESIEELRGFLRMKDRATFLF